MEKRNKTGIIVWLCIMLAVTVGIEIRERWTWRLFGNLQQEDVVSVDVHYWVYRTYPVSESDQEKLVALLQKIRVSKRLDELIIADGGTSRMFQLHMKDGTDIIISASCDMFYVNDICYRCDGDSPEFRDIEKMYEAYGKIIESNRVMKNLTITFANLMLT